jgi:hypothetical protein
MCFSYMLSKLQFAYNASVIATDILDAHINTTDPGYNDIGLSNTSSMASDVLWCQFIPHY